MKRFWAVVLTAATLASCRSNQPATNPFMRTTVPPPGTTGVMVTPGQPYAQGISPPLVTQPAPVITTPPVVTTQPVPVAAPPAAPMAAPPSVAPQGDQFRYPGGSYIFHQSSNDPPPPAPDESRVQLASATLPAAESPTDSAVTQATYVEPARVHISTKPSQAPIIENPYVAAKNAQPAETPPAQPQVLATEPAARPLAQSAPAPAALPKSQSLAASQPKSPASKTPTSAASTAQIAAPTRISLGATRGDPSAGAGYVPAAANVGSSTLRIVGESSPPTASPLVASNPATQMAIAPPVTQPTSTGSVMRITAGDRTPAIRSTVETAAPSTDVAIKSSSSGATTARIVSSPAGDNKDVIQTSFQPAGANTTISIATPSR